MSETASRKMKLILGPLCWLLMIVILPHGQFSFEARAAIGTILWMGIWWVTLPVAAGVTAFIPVVVNAAVCMIPMEDVLANYGSETVILLLGADLLSISWEYTGLDKRISLKSLCLIGPSLKQQIIVWFTVSTVLSMFLPNAVICAMLTPIALSMLNFIGEQDLKTGKTAAVIVTSIAWGSGIGGMGTPLGGAMNLIAVSYIEELTGAEFMYTAWFVRMIPMLVLVVLVDIICLMLIRPKETNLKGSKEYFHKLYADLPEMNRDEAISLVMFIAVIALSFTRELYADILPGLKPAYVFLIAGIMTFVISNRERKPMLIWKTAEKKVFWGMIFMFAGAMAVGTLLTGTGATTGIAELLTAMDLQGGFFTILAFTTFTVVLSEISNNTSAAAISVPIVISMTQKLGLDPIPYIYITIAAFNCAYMLPTTVRAIPVGMGLPPKYLLKKGSLLTISSILVISVAGWLMYEFWPLFRTV